MCPSPEFLEIPVRVALEQSFGRNEAFLFRGAISKGSRELAEAIKATQYSGLNFVGVPKRNFPGIDGIFLQPSWFFFDEAIPVSLKGFDKPPSALDIIRAAHLAADQIESASKALQAPMSGAQIFIDAQSLSIHTIDVSNLAQLTGKGLVGKIVVFGGDGRLVCENGTCSTN